MGGLGLTPVPDTAVAPPDVAPLVAWADGRGSAWARAGGVRVRHAVAPGIAGAVLLEGGTVHRAPGARRRELLFALRREEAVVLATTGHDALALSGRDGTPVLVSLDAPVLAFERIHVRVDGDLRLRERRVPGATPGVPAALRMALAEGEETPRVRGATPLQRAAFAIARELADRGEAGVTRRIVAALALSGARLESWRRTAPGLLSVRWVPPAGGAPGIIETLVEENGLGVHRAGVCVRGEDRRFDLAGIASAIVRQPWSDPYGSGDAGW